MWRIGRSVNNEKCFKLDFLPSQIVLDFYSNSTYFSHAGIQIQGLFQIGKTLSPWGTPGNDSITVHHASIGWPGRRCPAIDLPCIRRRLTALFGPVANLTSSWVSIHHHYVLSPHRPLLTPLCCSACRSCCTAFLLGSLESQPSITWVLSPPW
jgi:hypothetical protein